MATPDKTAAVAEIVEDFRTANATVLTEYRGLSVGLMKQLRRSLGVKNKYSVVKNTLTKIAAKEAGVDLDPALLAGPSAVAFIKGDPIDAAKALRDFAKENPLLIIKGGIFDGKAVTTAEIMQLANLESREVLLAKIAGALKASMSKALVELTEFVKAFETEFDVTAAAPVAVAAAGGAAAGAADAAQDEFTIILEDAGSQKIAVIKEVRALNSSLGLKEAKDLVDATPATIMEKADKATADKAKAAFEAAGAKVTIK
ncbi:MAG: 50S ribosomal protein L10 [Actinobacteria bacterium]|nr:50S ribosomal protein L10 [Actinomycetota bacterium]